MLKLENSLYSIKKYLFIDHISKISENFMDMKLNKTITHTKTKH